MYIYIFPGSNNVHKPNNKVVVVPKNNKKTISQHECGFCEKTFASLKFLEIHLNICNKQQNNAEQSQKIAPKNIYNGKRKLEDSRKISASKQTNAIGKKNYIKTCPKGFGLKLANLGLKTPLKSQAEPS